MRTLHKKKIDQQHKRKFLTVEVLTLLENIVFRIITHCKQTSMV